MLFDELNKHGFLLLKDVISKDDIVFGRKCYIPPDLLNYTEMNKYVDKCLSIVKQQIFPTLKDNIICTKYRASDNNNNTDAGAFHRDLVSFNGVNPPVFTVLSYLDVSKMSIIPESHKHLHNNPLKAWYMRKKAKTILINPGDILIFFATCLHKGEFVHNQNHRRLIQMFDVFPNSKVYQTLHPKILHLKCKNECDSYSWMANLAKYVSTSGYRYVVNEIMYYNNAYGYGYVFKPLHNTSYDYISTEAVAKRTINQSKNNDIQKNNLYHPLMKTNVPSNDKEWKRIRMRFYNYNYYMILCIFISLMILVISIIRFLVKIL